MLNETVSTLEQAGRRCTSFARPIVTAVTVGLALGVLVAGAGCATQAEPRPQVVDLRGETERSENRQDANGQPTAPASDAAESGPPRAVESRSTSGDGEVVARFEHVTLSRERLVEFLLHTRGLDALLNLMQLELARDQARERGVSVSREEIEAEERRTLEQAFAGLADIAPEEYPELLEQLLARQQVSRAEFDVVIETNAYLRAMAEPVVARSLDDETLREAFNIRYGEQVRVRHIAVENLATAARVRQELEAGRGFAELAVEHSQEPGTAQVGGLLPPFSRQSDVPEAFREAAFALEVGEVSDPVEAVGFYHLIKLEERIEPRAVRFENVKDQLREQLVEEQSVLLMRQLRGGLAQALGSGQLQIEDAELARQLAARLEATQPRPMEADELRQQMERERPGSDQPQQPQIPGEQDLQPQGQPQPAEPDAAGDPGGDPGVDQEQ